MLADRYWKRRAEKNKIENHTLTKLELCTLAADTQVLEALEKFAGSLVSSWLTDFKHRIKKLPESERTRFDEVKRQVGRPAIDELYFSNRLTLDWSLPSIISSIRGAALDPPPPNNQ